MVDVVRRMRRQSFKSDEEQQAWKGLADDDKAIGCDACGQSNQKQVSINTGRNYNDVKELNVEMEGDGCDDGEANVEGREDADASSREHMTMFDSPVCLAAGRCTGGIKRRFEYATARCTCIQNVRCTICMAFRARAALCRGSTSNHGSLCRHRRPTEPHMERLSYWDLICSRPRMMQDRGWEAHADH